MLAAYTINRMGNWIGYVALSLAVYDHTHSAFAVSAVLLSAQALPALLVPALVARLESSQRHGALGLAVHVRGGGDRGDRRADLAFLAAGPAGARGGRRDGRGGRERAAYARNSPASRASTPNASTSATPRPRLPRPSAASRQAAPGQRTRRDGPHGSSRPRGRAASANAALNVAFSVSFVLGPAIGGVVVASAGAPAALLLDVASFLVCAALLIDFTPHVEDPESRSVGARLAAAWRHINEAPALRQLILVEAVALVFAESAGPIEVAFAKSTLRVGDAGFGLLVGAWGAGAVLGSLVFARSLSRPLGFLLAIGTLAVGLSYVGFAVAPALWFAVGAALIGGVGNGVELPSFTSIVQRITPKALHARMMAAVESVVALCVAIGLPLGGALAALTNPRVAFLVVGLGAAATTPLLLRFSMQGAAAAEQREGAPAPPAPAPR